MGVIVSLRNFILFILVLVGCSRPAVIHREPAVMTRPMPTAAPSLFDKTLARIRGSHPPTAQPPVNRRKATQADACQSADGRWVCTGVKAPLKAGGGPATAPIIPPSWTVPGWYVDTSNSLGCAADTNSGTSPTCLGGCTGGACPSGVGPLLTYEELNVHRWGCQGNPSACPRLQQNTTLTFLSNPVNADEVLNLAPSIEFGSYLNIDCALGPAQIVGTGTLNAVTSKNRASNQALTTTFTTLTGAFSANDLVLNSTNISTAWTMRDTGGSVWLISQPLAAITAPVVNSFGPTLTEVDTPGWSHADSVTAYALVQLPLVSARPVLTAFDNNLSAGLYVTHCDLEPPFGSPLASGIELGDNVMLVESTAGPAIQLNAGTGFWNAALNSTAVYYASSTLTGTSSPIFGGGVTTSVNSGATYYFDYDFVFMGPTHEYDISSSIAQNVGAVYIDTSSYLVGISPGGVWIDVGASGIAQVYGPGGLAVHQRGRIQYPAGGAVGSMLQSGGLDMNNVGFACSHTSASPDVSYCGIALTAVNLDAPAGAAGFGGNAFIPGCGSISNFPQ